MSEPAKSNPLCYPRWIVRPDGASVVVPDHLQHSAVTGRKYDENANLIEDEPPKEEEELAGLFVNPGEETLVPEGEEPEGEADNVNAD